MALPCGPPNVASPRAKEARSLNRMEYTKEKKDYAQEHSHLITMQRSPTPLSEMHRATPWP